MAGAHAGLRTFLGLQALQMSSGEENYDSCRSRRLPGGAEDILEYSEQTQQAPLAASKQQLAEQPSAQQPAAQASSFLHEDGEPIVKQIRQAVIVLLSKMLPCALRQCS